MGAYVETPRLTAWYDSAGSGEPLVLLHGGLVTNESWAGQMPAFAERFEVFAPERRAHGRTADVDGPLTYADMAADTIEFLEAVVKEPAHLVGWSVERWRNSRTPRHDRASGPRPQACHDQRQLQARGGIRACRGSTPSNHRPRGRNSWHVPLDARRQLPDGPEHWPAFVEKYFAMLRVNQPDLQSTQLAGVSVPALVVTADDDIVRLEHTLELYRAVPRSQLAVVPGTSHALIFEKPGLVNDLVLDFLEVKRLRR